MLQKNYFRKTGIPHTQIQSLYPTIYSWLSIRWLLSESREEANVPDIHEVLQICCQAQETMNKLMFSVMTKHFFYETGYAYVNVYTTILFLI